MKENLRSSSRVKSFLAMIGPEAKISKDGTSAISFHLATLACHLACIGCNYELFNSTLLFLSFQIFLFLERKNYESSLLHLDIWMEGEKLLDDVVLCAKTVDRRNSLSRRLANCCSMKKWRDKSFTGVRVSPSR